jgi:DNA-binding PadR family transcriptional regulator
MKEYIDLSPTTFHILLSISREAMHGYDIMKTVSLETDDQINLSPGTLYGAIKRLLELKWITVASAPKGSDPRRKYYKASNLGNYVVGEHVDTMKQYLKLARRYQFIGTLWIFTKQSA